MKWFRKAAEQGHREARYNLYDCYENGIGVEKDEIEAKKWYDMLDDETKDSVSADAEDNVLYDSPKEFATMSEIIENAKRDGKNWTEEQWKEAFKSMLKGMKPMYDEIVQMQEEMSAMESMSEEEQVVAAANIMKKAEEMQKRYGNIEHLMDEFEKVANATEIGKKVFNDEDFGKQCLEELGMNKIEI